MAGVLVKAPNVAGPAIESDSVAGTVPPALVSRWVSQYTFVAPGTGSMHRASPWFELPSRNVVWSTSSSYGPLYLRM
jgi:hypothetical protein